MSQSLETQNSEHILFMTLVKQAILLEHPFWGLATGIYGPAVLVGDEFRYFRPPPTHFKRLAEGIVAADKEFSAKLTSAIEQLCLPTKEPRLLKIAKNLYPDSSPQFICPICKKTDCFYMDICPEQQLIRIDKDKELSIAEIHIEL